MIDHTGIAVSPDKYEELVKWYLAALAPLGYTKQTEMAGKATGFGPEGKPIFWVASKADAKPNPGFHIAFQAKDHASVEKFHAEAEKAGGTCNGKPGLREYHPNYYGAFVLDPLGNNVEAVDHVAH